MPRLERGSDPKIDHINDLVLVVKEGYKYSRDGITYDKKSAMNELIEMFTPLMLKICSKWIRYFQNTSTNGSGSGGMARYSGDNQQYAKKIHGGIKTMDELMSDAAYWFIVYTDQYTIDGAATYNKFINDHIDQRIRYICECELKYVNRHIFPDPDKRDAHEGKLGADPMETIVSRYSSEYNCSGDFVESMGEEQVSEYRSRLAHRILDIINNNPSFSSRDKVIFVEIMCNGAYHESIGNKYNISRTRVTHILKKVKTRLYKLMEEDCEIWDLINKTDIEISKWLEE